MSKLTHEQVVNIHELREQGWSTYELARHFNKSRSTIQEVLREDPYEEDERVHAASYAYFMQEGWRE